VQRWSLGDFDTEAGDFLVPRQINWLGSFDDAPAVRPTPPPAATGRSGHPPRSGLDSARVRSVLGRASRFPGRAEPEGRRSPEVKAPPATLPRPLSSLPGGLATRVDSGNRQWAVSDLPPTEGVRPPAPGRPGKHPALPCTGPSRRQGSGRPDRAYRGKDGGRRRSQAASRWPFRPGRTRCRSSRLSRKAGQPGGPLVPRILRG
jgi:hypothetical protein